jgi:hypothetical protein
MAKVSLAAGIILLAGIEAFCPGEISVARPASFLSMADGPAGTFFHQVPDEEEQDGRSSAESIDIDAQVSELLRQRRKPPLASKPSTLNGVPTGQATGESLQHSRWSFSVVSATSQL